jgi:hypothetical protein
MVEAATHEKYCCWGCYTSLNTTEANKLETFQQNERTQESMQQNRSGEAKSLSGFQAF